MESPPIRNLRNTDVFVSGTTNARCLTVIVPVYNEAATVEALIKQVSSSPVVKEIVIVDDASTDGTRQTLQKLEKSLNLDSITLHFLFHGRNQGKGAAIRTGIEKASSDFTIIQDADLEYDTKEYPRLLEPILAGEADVVYGTRFAAGGRRRVLLFWHTLGNKFLTLLSNLFTNLNLSDMETCYKIFKTDILKSIPIRSNRFGFEPEITAKVAKLHCSIFEVPISYLGRGYAEGKKINWTDGLSAIWTILKFWVRDDLFKEDAGHRTLRIMEGAGDYNRWLFEQAKPHLGERVLEIGSGVGNITKYLQDKPAVLATDLNLHYLDELKRKFSKFDNVSVLKLDLLDTPAVEALKKDRPDTVLSMNVLEHIDDDKKAVANIVKVLPPGGRVVLVLPAHQLLFSKMDKNLGHHRRYSKQQLVSLLESSGLIMETSRYLNGVGALGWFINGRILNRGIIPSRQLRIFDFLSWILKIEKLIQPPFGLSVFAVAKKPS
jgi:glycosyltransferase involved in cell wall biosynthesis